MTTDRFEIEREGRDGDEHVLALRVPRELAYFQGHFEGDPILPGIAEIVGVVDREARRLLGPLGGAKRLTRVKFMAIVRPDDELTLRLSRADAEGEARLTFRLEVMREGGAAIASQGAITYAAR